jgi:hypothetical protein
VLTISITVQCSQNEAQLFQIKIRLTIKKLSSTDKQEDKLFLDASGVTRKIIILNVLSVNYI